MLGRPQFFSRLYPSGGSKWLIGGILLLALGALSRSILRAPIGEHGVTASPAFYDFGEVGQEETLTHTFTVRNGWDRTVVISKVTSSCGCTTVPNLEGHLLLPGDSIKVPVSLKTGRGEEEDGGIITLFYRANNTSLSALNALDLSVRAVIVPDYIIQPNVIDFGIVNDLEPRRRTVHLRQVGNQSVKVSGFNRRHGAFSARLLRQVGSGDDAEVEIAFCGTGIFHDEVVSDVIEVNTTSSSAPSTRVRVRATFEAPIKIEPRTIILRNSDLQKERNIYIRSKYPIAILNARSTNARIGVHAKLNLPAHEHCVRLSISPAPRVPSAFDAQVQVDLAYSIDAVRTEARTAVVSLHCLAVQ